MRDIVSSVAVGKVSDKICVDLDKDEEVLQIHQNFQVVSQVDCFAISTL